MSLQAMSRVMSDSEAAGYARLVLLIMANRAGGDDDVCWASVERIAYECRADTRTVQRNIRRLTEAGDLVFVGRHPKYGTNQYEVAPRGRTFIEREPDGGRLVEKPSPNEGVAQRRGGARGGTTPPELDLELGSELGSKGSRTSLGTTAQTAADAAVIVDNFPADDWRYLLGKLHDAGWTAQGHGALSWGFLMALRNDYGWRIVDSALRDATFNDQPPGMSSAAYFRSICERFKAEVAAS